MPALPVAVVFDLDGTLLDHEGAVRNARRVSFAEQRRRRLRDFLPLLGLQPGGNADLDRVFAGYLACYEASRTKFDDVDPALALLAASGIRTAVLTNGARHQQNAKLRAVGLLDALGPVLTAEELGVSKPDRAAYLAACARLDAPPGAVLHVGDLYDLDVLGARAAGLRAVHLDRSGRGPASESQRIASLGDLSRYLDRGGPRSA